MNPEEKAKTTSPVVTDAAAKEVIPAKPTGELSEQDLAGVAGGAPISTTRSNIKRPGVAADETTTSLGQVSTTR